MDTEQGEVIAYLSRAETYGQSGDQVEIIETHAAIIFLAGAYAYKMKREVTYSFLDFSSRGKRRSALEEELRLNRRTAPDLYLRLVPVTRDSQGRLALEGEGEEVEPLLQMVRFDQDDRLDMVARQGRLSHCMIDDLAAEIVTLHGEATIHHDAGGYDGLLEVIEGNAGDLRELFAKGLLDERVEVLSERTSYQLERQRTRLERRRSTGFVRWCHGDLHLRNIVLFNGRPLLFDCLEFSPALARIDTFYDLAFLIFDLCHQNMRPAAQRLMNAYVEATEDDQGTSLVPLFGSVRAAIRAKVEALTATAVQDDADRAPALEEARSCLELALAFLAPVPPRLVAIGGVSGTGKSTLALAVAPLIGALPGASVLRSDGVRKRLLASNSNDALPEQAYRSEVSVRVYDHMLERAATLLRSGRTVILDATFLDVGERREAEKLATAQRVPFLGLWLTADPSILEERVRRRRDDLSDATVAVLRRQLAAHGGAMDWLQVDAGGTPASVTSAALAILRSAKAGA